MDTTSYHLPGSNFGFLSTGDLSHGTEGSHPLGFLGSHSWASYSLGGVR